MQRFDPWNSSSTGHQVADGRGPQGWREMRTARLQSQLASLTGGPRLASTDDGSKPKTSSVADMLRNPGSMLTSSSSLLLATAADAQTAEERLSLAREKEDKDRRSNIDGAKKNLLDGVVVYVNGSTHPAISDHRLKRLLAEHGAQTALHLGRRRVTHVIVGRPATGSGAPGAGGGLAGMKLDKEIRRLGGCAVKYVGVEWVLESVKAGRRLPEARFVPLKIAARSQRGVFGAFEKAERAGG